MSRLRPGLSLALRCGLALPFLVAGVGRLLDPVNGAAEMAHFGLPWPDATNLAVAALQLGGAGLLVGGQPVGGLLLALFTLAATLLAHRPWADAAQTIPFTEHIAITAGLLLAAGTAGRR